MLEKIMLKGNCVTHNLFIIALIVLSIKIASSEKVVNCHRYKIQGIYQVCDRCIYGYILGVDGNCSPKILVKVVSLLMSVKYMEPFISFRSIFCEFMGQYWFFASNRSHSFILRELTQFMIAINNERLWPFNIKEKFELLIGKQKINKFHNFLGIQNKPSGRDFSSAKRDLFIFDKVEFSFTSACGIRLLISLVISLAIFLTLQLVEGIVYLLTEKRIFEKRQIKGSLILMIMGQLYHFVGFYGFYEFRNLQGYSRFGMKLNIGIAALILFIFLFMAITLLPIIYHINQTGPQNLTLKQSKASKPKETVKIHRFLTFANTPLGFTYYLIYGSFRHFCLGCITGYFYDGNTQYIVLALWYGIEYLLIEDVDGSLSERVYFFFRKGYVIVNIGFLMLLIEENVHVFSQSDYSFMPVLEICMCFVYIIALGQFLLQFIEIAWKFLSKIKNWLKIKNKVYNAGPIKKTNQKSAKRKLLREPSIAEKLLTALKTIKGV